MYLNLYCVKIDVPTQQYDLHAEHHRACVTVYHHAVGVSVHRRHVHRRVAGRRLKVKVGEVDGQPLDDVQPTAARRQVQGRPAALVSRPAHTGHYGH